MKHLNELNPGELKLVFENNSKLQKEVLNDMFENANYWSGEYLKCWKRGAIDYCIGWDRGTYFEVKDRQEFIDGLKEAQNTFCFLADEWNKKINYAEHLINRLNNLVYWDEVNEERLNNRIDELIEELETACYKRLMSEYEECFDSENQLNYFLEFYSNERIDDNFYVDENYTLYEHIDYVKNYT